MRSLRTLVGFVLILGLLTLGVVGLEYLGAPLGLQLAFAVLLAAFGLITFGIAVMSRPSAGSLLAMAAAAIALFVGVRGSFAGTLDLLLFSLVIFDVIVLFVLSGEIDHERLHRHASRPVPRAPQVAGSRSAQSATAKAPAAQTSSAKSAKPATRSSAAKSSRKTTTKRSTRSSPARSSRKSAKSPARKAPTKKTTKRSSGTSATKKSRKAPTKKTAAKRTSSRRSSAVKTVREVAHRFVASRDRKGSAFHLVNCYLAQRIDEDAKAHFATREAALEAGHRPCRVCNP